MNLKSQLALVLFSALVLTSSAHAEGPCKAAREKIMKACEAAGFYQGGHKEGKGLYKDCMQKIKAGEKVAGVADLSGDADVKACQERRAQRKAKSGS